MKHAIVKLGDYKIPLIGIPEEAGLETCDCCGDTIGLSYATFTGSQILCSKCLKSWSSSVDEPPP